MLREEWKKVAIHYGMLPIIFVFIFCIAWLKMSDKMVEDINLDTMKEIYAQIVQENDLQGKWTKEKQNRFDSILSENEKQLLLRSRTVKAYASGNCDKQTYFEIMEQTKKAQDENATLKK